MALPVTSCLRCGWAKWHPPKQIGQSGHLRCSSLYVRPPQTTRLQVNGNYGASIKHVSECVEWGIGHDRQTGTADERHRDDPLG